MKRHCQRQATYCSAFGADFTARLLRELLNCISAGRDLGQRIANWLSDPRAKGRQPPS